MCLKLIIKTPEKSIVQTPPPPHPPVFSGGSEKLKKGVVV